MNDVYHGKGVFHYMNGDKFEGLFDNGVKTNKGVSAILN